MKQLVCDECGTQISMSESDAELFEGACCTRNDCNGHMHIAEDKGLDFTANYIVRVSLFVLWQRSIQVCLNEMIVRI